MEEKQGVETQKTIQHKIERIFKTYDLIYVNAKSKERTALIASMIQRSFGKNHVFFSQPYFNKKTKFWTLRISVDIPKTLLHTFLNYPTFSSEVKGAH